MSEYGQINELTERWKIIKDILKSNKFQNIVEIGTWRGMGSTLCILLNKNKNSNFLSLETNYENYNIAKENLKKYENDFELIHGRIIEISDVNNFISDMVLSEEQKIWLRNDLIDFEKTQNVLNKIPEKIDFLLLDGGEFSTFPEWSKLKNRTKFVALDDINVLKCKKIFLELSNDSSYELLSTTNEGHGFSVFKKIN